MGELRYAIRFFHVVPPLPRLLVATFCAVSVVSAVAIAVRPASVPRALAPVLLLQMFAASSGFGASARRGYYDLLLTRGHNRVQVAIVHWLVSVAPGLACWIALAVVELAATRGSSATALASGTAFAMMLLSTIPWAITVPLPRFAGAIGWVLLALVAIALVPQGPGLGIAAFPETRSWTAVVALALFPPMAVGRDLSAADCALVAPGLLAALLAMIVACVWIHRADVPLEAAQ